MYIATLRSNCINVILQQFCLFHYGKTSSKLIGQFQQCGLAEVFSHEILNILVDWYPTIVSDEILELICHESLRSLKLSKCKNVTLAGLQKLLQDKCPDISMLDLSECDQLMKKELPKLLKQSAKRLFSLKIENCFGLTDQILQEILISCDGIEIVSVEGCEQLQDDLIFYHIVNSACAHNLTAVNVSGCRNISSSFIRHLTAVTRSNLQSVNISWTNIDCTALVYLAGYPLQTAIEIATRINETGKEFSSNDATPNLEQYNAISAPIENDDNSLKKSVQSASVYLKELCAYCTPEMAVRQHSQSSINVFSESYEDYDVIDSQVLNIFERNKAFMNSCANAANILHLDWEILSIDDVNILTKPDFCTCLTSCKTDSDISLDKKLQYPMKIEDNLHQLFIPNITSLDITAIDFYDFDVGKMCIELFMNCNPKLEQFHISWHQTDEEVISYIAKSSKYLYSLSLVDCDRITNGSIIQIAEYTSMLRAVDLKGVPFITDPALLELINNNPKIQRLCLAESALTDVVLKRISECLSKSLNTLDLSWCENISDKGVFDIVASCERLCSLDLRQCDVSGATIAAISQYGKHLSSLGLCGIKGLNDNNCQVMIKSLRYLRKIDMSWNSSLTDVSISTLFQSCSYLREVSVAGLKRITTKPFLPIISGFTNWQYCRERIRSRLQLQMGKMKDSSELEILDSEFYLPFRSVHYAPELRKLHLGYCDKINDDYLSEIVAVCRDTLEVEDYYGETIKPKWSNSSKLKCLY